MKTICLFFLLITQICYSQDSLKVDLKRSLDKTKKIYGVITMNYYTSAQIENPNCKYYGWINYGDGVGRQEIATKEEWNKLWERYMEK
jgi:hypothetical protein